MADRRLKLNPVYLGIFFFVLAQLLTFFVVDRENAFLEANDIYVPHQEPSEVLLWPTPPPTPSPGEVVPPQPPPFTALGPILLYFMVVVIVLGVVLFLVPLAVLRVLLRLLFAFLFGWGVFIILVFYLPVSATLGIAAAVGLAWFFWPRVWLHDLVMVLTMVSIGAVFGRIISPVTAIILLLALSLYDLLAVRFGYMLWMAKKMTESSTLPAFILPRFMSEWNASLRQPSVSKLVDKKAAEREHSILGGGDIGFPLLLAAAVYFAYGLPSGLIVAGFTLAGLIAAYWIQSAFLKGKAMPALPPIAVLGLVGLLIVRAS